MKTYNTIVTSKEVEVLANVVARCPYECVKLDENRYGFMDNESGDIRNYFCDTLGYECSSYEAFDFEYFDEPIKLDPEIYLFASKIASSLNKRITFTYNKKQKRIEYVIMSPNDENIQLGFDFHETNRKELIFMADIYVKSENRWFIITKNIDNTYTLQENTEGDDIKYIKDYESSLDTCISSLLKEISTKKSSTKEPQSVEPNKPNFYTQNGWQGSKYDSKKGAKEVAKELRAYIKANPDLNACKWSIRSKWGTVADSLYISLMAAPFDPFTDEYKTRYEYRYNRGYSEHGDIEDYTTPEAYKLIKKAKAFVMQYIHDDSDGMIDYFDRNIYDHYEIGQYDKPFQLIEKKESPKQGEPSKEANEVKASESVVTVEGMEIVDYSEKAIAVFGDTKAIKEELKKLGGKFNPALKYNGEKRAGWIFSKKQADKVRALLAPSVETVESVTLPELPKEIDITDALDEMKEKEETKPVKLYNTTFGVGTAKYVVNFHDGIKRHNDGSRFYDIRIFSNKKEMGKFIKELEKEGYKLDTFFNESKPAEGKGDKPYPVKNILESLKDDIEAGSITIDEATRELYEAGYIIDMETKEAVAKLGLTEAEPESDRIAFVKDSKNENLIKKHGKSLQDIIDQTTRLNGYAGINWYWNFKREKQIGDIYSRYVTNIQKLGGLLDPNKKFAKEEYSSINLPEMKQEYDIVVESIEGNWYTIRLNKQIELKSKRIRKYENGCIAVPESVYNKLQGKYNVMCNF